MDIDYDRDDARRLVRASLTGVFDGAALMILADRMRSEGAWAYGLLLDARRLSSLPTAQDLTRLTDYVSPDSATATARGPLALVVQDEDLYARACVYLTLGVARGRRIDVFRHVPDAEAWLSKA